MVSASVVLVEKKAPASQRNGPVSGEWKVISPTTRRISLSSSRAPMRPKDPKLINALEAS